MSKSRDIWARKSGRRKRMLKRLFDLHHGQCAHCGRQCRRNTSHFWRADMATVDHEPPRCELPVEEWWNDEHAVLSCGECNRDREQAMTRAKLSENAA